MTLWLAIAAVALLNFAFKAAGPAVLGGRELPARTRSVIAYLAPALLAGFVVVDVAGPGWQALDPAVLAGLAAVPVLRRFRVPLPAVMLAAVGLAALVRLWVA